jgi:uncharacterized protein (DUF1697 family)
MKYYIVLLRGINVGGHNRLPMADLRLLLNNNGYTNICTYIQSGNILLSSDKKHEDISENIEDVIKTKFNYNIPVITISATELQTCFEGNPYTESEENIKFLHVTFLNDSQKSDAINNLNISIYNNDEFKIINKFVYLHTPDGFAKTKFSNTQFEKQLNTKATTRNWKTITKLMELSKKIAKN